MAPTTRLVIWSVASLLARALAGSCNSAPTLVQLKGRRSRATPGSVQNFQWLGHNAGQCLEARSRKANGARPRLQACDENKLNQTWSYEEETGLLRHHGGKCLDASQRFINAGLVHLWACDSSNPNQIWDFNATSMQIKNSDGGRCLDSPLPYTSRSRVHVWSCDVSNINQQWALEENVAAISSTTTTTTPSSTVFMSSTSTEQSTTSADITDSPSTTSSSMTTPVSKASTTTTISATTTTTATATATSTTTTTTASSTKASSTTRKASDTTSIATTSSTTFTSSSTSTSSATTKAGALLSAVRNCQLKPLVEGAGCRLLRVFESQQEFGLNKFGQETSGRQACLKRLRDESQADVFVHSVERCELWLCGTVSRLKSSSGPGGLAGKGNIAFQNHLGAFLSAHEDGTIHGRGDEFDPESQFRIVPVGAKKIALMANNGKFLKASPSGYLSAKSEKQDKWEEFELVNSTGGKIGIKSYFGRFVTVERSGFTIANRPTIDAWEEFALVSHSSPEKIPGNITSRPRAAVFSNLCKYQPGQGGLHGKVTRSPVFVKLWEWNFPDVARECEEYLGPNGVDGVQISPVVEHIRGHQWWTKYQPVSQGLNSRSGTREQFTDMVARCRAAGVEVIVDLLLNHMASPCKAAKQNTSASMPCEGWAGSKYGHRMFEGAHGWDMGKPDMFHHKTGKPMKGQCAVGPWTGWLCPKNDCTPCDMYGMPDWATELDVVRDMHARHLEELFSIGVTMLRLDAAIYHHIEDLASMLNRVPWDLVYQEWWGEFPPAERTQHVGSYRDVSYRWKVVNLLGIQHVNKTPDLLELDGGVHGISEDMAVYPFAYHDGRSLHPDSQKATYKNGLEFHQQQKFFLAWPHGISTLVWGGYTWTNMEQGPPGCEKGMDHCSAKPVFGDDGEPRCMATPTKSPMPKKLRRQRQWVCEHRWQGVAGMINFRKACRDLPLVESWNHRDESKNVTAGRLAFRLSSEDNSRMCFAALVRGYNTVRKPSWGHLGDWRLQGLTIKFPPGRYCDLASLSTQKGWDRKSCPREVLVGPDGKVDAGTVPEGDLVAIHTGAKLSDATQATD